MIKKYYYNSQTPEPEYYTITAKTLYSGEATFTGAGTYPKGSTVTITCTPANGFTFIRWSNLKTTTSITINNLNQDYDLTAYVSTTKYYQLLLGYAADKDETSAIVKCINFTGDQSTAEFGYIFKYDGYQMLNLENFISSFNYNKPVTITLPDSNHYLNIKGSDGNEYTNYTFDESKNQYTLYSFADGDITGYPNNIKSIKYPVCEIKIKEALNENNTSN